MSIVGAYIDTGQGSNFHWGSDEPYVEADFLGKTPEGLEVEWRGDPPPDRAKVYLYWEPRVVAVWNNEEGIENGEDGEDADGSDVEQRDEEVPAEPDLGTGEGGEGVAMYRPQEPKEGTKRLSEPSVTLSPQTIQKISEAVEPHLVIDPDKV